MCVKCKREKEDQGVYVRERRKMCKRGTMKEAVCETERKNQNVRERSPKPV